MSLNTQVVPNSFFASIKNSKMLKKSDELALIKHYRETGDINSRDKVILANKRFVISAALEFRNSGIELQDLFSEGMYGLIYAVDQFDLNKDVKFVSYAVYWVKHYMRKCINDNSPVKVPTGTVKELRKKIANGTISDVENDVISQMALNAMQYPISLDSKCDPNDSSSHTIGETIEDDRVFSPEKRHYKHILSEELVKIINGTLAPVKAEIILKTYGLGYHEAEQTLRDISCNSKYSHERIRQLRKEALRELRNNKDIQTYQRKYNEYSKLK